MVTTESLIILKQQLPPNWARKIQERLEKRKIIYSLSYIYRVLDPDQPEKTNEDILTEAIDLRDEHLLHIADIENRILHPSLV